jgi:hypothetical protein
MSAAKSWVLGLSGVLLVAPLAGCMFMEPEAVCSEGEYPAYSEKFPETGGYCVPDGEQPDKGFAAYPEGLVPEYVSEQNGPLAITCPKSYPAEPCTIAGQELPLPKTR